MGEISAKETFKAIKDYTLARANPTLWEVYMDWQEKLKATNSEKVKLIGYGWLGWIFYNKECRAAKAAYQKSKVHSDEAREQFLLVKKLLQEPDYLLKRN